MRSELPALAQERMSRVDAAWLRMDSPTNPMVITALLVLAGRFSRSALETLVAEKVLRWPRFRQLAIPQRTPFDAPRWRPDPHFDVRAHLRSARLPEPNDENALARLLGELASTPLSSDRPLWQLQLIEEAQGGDSALVLRVHHSLADGAALVRVLLDSFDGPSSEPERVGLERRREKGAPARLHRAGQRAATLARLLALPFDAASALRRPLGHCKLVAWSRAIDLAETRELAAALQVTLNDLLQACVAVAVQRHLERAPRSARDEHLRSLVPVLLRDGASRHAGNHFGLVFLDLPLGALDPVARVRIVHDRMSRLKAGDDATVAFGVLDLLGTVHPRLEAFALNVFTRKASLLTTNVPGPKERACLGGHLLKTLLVWAPTSAAIGLGFTLVSYGGELRLGVLADAAIAAQPAQLAHDFENALAALKGHVAGAF